MRPSTRALAPLFGALLLAACAGPAAPPIDCSPAPTVTAAEALRIAESYRTLRWTPAEANILHGPDPEGIRVDTPDTTLDPRSAPRPGWWHPGHPAVGIPYQWGGFDTPAGFLQRAAAGCPAGDVYTPAKRAGLQNAVSRHACGIDCSGFISRCWRLPRSYSTRELPSLCDPLPSYDDLQPGDMLNKRNVHTLLFVCWLDGRKSRFRAYETGSPPTWKVLSHPIGVDYVRGLGYEPYRYRGMRGNHAAAP